MPLLLVMFTGALSVDHVTLWRAPAFQTVPACGYVIGGTKTSRASRVTGAAETNAIRLKRSAPKRRVSADERDLACIIVDREVWVCAVREVVRM